MSARCVDKALAVALLGAHVRRRADDHAGARVLRHRPAGVRRQLGDAKVEQLGVVAVAVPRTQVDVLGLQIAVDNALGVAGGQRRGTLRQDAAASRESRHPRDACAPPGSRRRDTP
jgi:hypothetical protein